MITRKPLSVLLISLFALVSCDKAKKQWVFVETLPLDGVSPIGMVPVGDDLWLSDVDHNRLVKIDETGKIQQEVNNLNRPMHIDSDGRIIYIPQYGGDNIVAWDGTILKPVALKNTLDAPGGVGVGFGLMAIADFFHHRVVVKTKDNEFTIGKEGHDNSSLYYPTDVKITEDKLYIADAYNNRVQVYDHQGNYLHTVGWQEGIKVATGVEVGNSQVFITDFHGDRLLVYNLDGQLLQTFQEHLDNPTDVLLAGGKLYVANYKGHSLAVFEFK